MNFFTLFTRRTESDERGHIFDEEERENAMQRNINEELSNLVITAKQDQSVEAILEILRSTLEENTIRYTSILSGDTECSAQIKTAIETAIRIANILSTERYKANASTPANTTLLQATAAM